MNYLNEWSNVINRQAEESSKREEERLKIVKKQGKDIIPERLSNIELLALYDHCVGCSGDHNPKIGKEFKKVAGKLRTEILARMVNLKATNISKKG